MVVWKEESLGIGTLASGYLRLTSTSPQHFWPSCAFQCAQTFPPLAVTSASLVTQQPSYLILRIQPVALNSDLSVFNSHSQPLVSTPHKLLYSPKQDLNHCQILCYITPPTPTELIKRGCRWDWMTCLWLCESEGEWGRWSCVKQDPVGLMTLTYSSNETIN